ncbi:MAG: hypothetical protein AW10_03991 [Candidatus Accumulibacter appositus]|uniref:Uncharacterized protein n=1 Tax=Candidatus Accumulibacter appositus TaxID=1454003 RepID=A0A011PJX8_9PROT|nr:MAG: hypothetical protein AW10_03991 [Candidatus Accumulibacter appositus]
MQRTHIVPSTGPDAKLTTDELVALFKAKSQTPRASLCRHGHWMGMVPVKLPNRTLLWDRAEADRLLAGETVQTPDDAQIAAHIARKTANPAKLPSHILRKAAAKAKRMATAKVEPQPIGEVAA